MLFFLTAVVSGTLGFLIAGFTFSVEDRWYDGAADEYQKGYEDGFREGRIRRELSEEKG